MKVWLDSGAAITLSKRNLIGSGGEAEVYGHSKSGIAIKIYHDPTAVMPEGKMRELEPIRSPSVLVPTGSVRDKSGARIGYAMPLLRDALALCQIFPRAFRDREGLNQSAIESLATRLRLAVEGVHKAGVLIVDLNEMNVLVDRALKSIFLIDADSYQTRSYPATALMESIRDRHAPKGSFTELTDWFAFAILSFQMFVGIHPYKGKHPTLKGLDERMKSNVSVFHADVRLPKTAYPLAAIPGDLRSWYEAVFERGERTAPPSTRGGTVYVPRIAAPAVGDALDLRSIRSYGAAIRAIDDLGSELVAVTDAGIWLGGRLVSPEQFPGERLVLSLRRQRPVRARLVDGEIELVDLDSGQTLPFRVAATSMVTSAGRLYAHAGEQILEIAIDDLAGQRVASSRVAATVLAHATELYSGVAFSRIATGARAVLFPRPGETFQLALPELDNHRVMLARFERGVLIATARHRSTGRLDRFVFRFADDFVSYDVRITRDVDTADVSFAVLDSGVCIAIDDEDQLELFHRKRGSSSLRRIDDPAITGDMLLAASGSRLVAGYGDTVYALSLR